MIAVFTLIAIGIAIALFVVPPIMRRYWQEETNMTDDDYAFDREVASFNSRLAHQQDDESLKRILTGQDHPTVADRYPAKHDDR